MRHRPLEPHRVDPRAVAALLCLATVLGSASAALPEPPPKAPSVPVRSTMFGVEVVDPYRNLEDLKSPATRAWLKAQGDYAAATLADIQGRDEIARRIEALGKAAGTLIREVVRMPGDRVYYLRRLAGESQLKLVERTGGSERVLVDPEALARASGVPHAINYFAPSWDGASLAYGISAGGSEEASLHVLDIATGKELIEPIPRVHEGSLHWTPDSRSLSFNQVRELPPGTPGTETFLDSTVFLIEPRAAAAKPRPLFGPLVNPELKLERLDVGEVIFAADSGFMVARTTDTTLPEGRLYVAPLAQLAAATPIRWLPVATAADKISQVELRGDTLYLRTYDKAPRGHVVALTLSAEPALKKAVEVVPEPDNGALQGFTLGKDAIYAAVLRGFNVRVRRYAGAKPGQGADLAPELVGTTALIDDAAHASTDAWVRNVTWTDPERIYTIGSGNVRDSGLLNNPRPADMPDVEVTEVLVKSHDGARVPLVILAKRGLPRNGDSPTLLVGYGSYGSTIKAYFDPRQAAWLERGGVIALANVRGSGAFGDPWYKAGFKKNKPNTWKDGIACARYLIAQKYASPATLGIWGTSAGGIFVGRAVTSAPDLFAAAIFDVGVMDAVRSEESANGITNISEFGSAKVAAEFPALLEMSTYHQIKAKTNYPAVLFIHGLNDPRVDVWHSAKTAALLQASSTSEKPILLRLDGQAGHGVGSTAEQRASKQADIYAFLLWQFGKLGLKP